MTRRPPRRLPPGHGLYPAYLERHGRERDFVTGYPKHFVEQVVAESELRDVRLRAAREVRRFRGARELRVNVGCGPHGKPGWVNLDARRWPGVDCVFDARKRLPFEDGSVRLLFCEHFLEHLEYSEEVPMFLAECLRCLAPGGVIRLVVPDARRYLEAYVQGDWAALTRIRPLRRGRRDAWLGCPIRTSLELVNLVFRQGGEHRFAWDRETLAHALRRQGFRRMREHACGQSRAAGLALDQAERASESLYVEAERPRAGSGRRRGGA